MCNCRCIYFFVPVNSTSENCFLYTHIYASCYKFSHAKSTIKLEQKTFKKCTIVGVYISLYL